MSNGSILLVDDDREMVDSFSRWFQRKGYQTTPTYHAMQSLMAAATHRYDVAVIDVGMPDMDGLELLKELVQLDLFPVIVLSGLTDKWTMLKALELGAVSYLVKPASMVLIERIIQESMRPANKQLSRLDKAGSPVIALPALSGCRMNNPH